MGWLRNARYAIEYGAARATLAGLRRLAPARACRVAEALGDAAFVLLRGRRRIAATNILAAGVAATPQQAARLARASFRHFAVLAAETFHPAAARAWEEGGIVLDAPEDTRRLLAAPGQGVLLVSAHLGNWEVPLRTLARIKPLAAVARPMNNPKVQALLERLGLRAAIEVIPKRAANPLRLVGALRRGRVLAILIDQHAPDNRVWVPFFGRPAATYTTPAVLHLLTGIPLVCGYALREGVLRYRVCLGPPRAFAPGPDRGADLERITAALTRELEDGIRRRPEQYLWAHRRWREVEDGGSIQVVR
jgi:KDO2-lipid IV(A) lauroyltransferase